MERLGRYKIESKIGQGAMGSVYKAWHPGFNDFVALKTLQNSAFEGSELLDRFRLEGQSLAKLKHQNIVQIYDADQADGTQFIVMEYVNGPGLDHIISERKDIPMARRLSYILAVCYALHYAHRRRLLHRDIKPANIMIQHDGDDEVTKVVDFGIARLLDFSQTTTNLFIGAPAYMAPELLTASERANEKTDIWALGVTMYELLAYRRPFEGTSLEELKRAIVHGQPKPLPQLFSECPGDLEAVVDRMLAKEPALRYQTVEDVLLDFEPIVRHLRSAAAAVLVQRATDYYEIGDLDTAKITLSEAKRYDAANTHIKELLLRILDELHRQELIPRMQGHVKRGRDYLQAGSFREAREEAQAALELDSRSEPAQKLIQEIEQALARGQLIEQKIRLTKQRLAEGLLTQAEEIFVEVEGLDASHPELRELKRQIADERQKREKSKRLNQILNQARALLASLDYEECLVAVGDGLKEFPANGELRKLQESTRAELAELEKQRAKHREIGEIRTLIGQEDFEGAITKLEQLAWAYPDDSSIRTLRAVAIEGAERQKRRKQREAGVAELRGLLSAGDYRSVVSRGGDLLQEFPNEREVEDIVNYAVAEIAEVELRRNREIFEDNIRGFLKAGDFRSAESEANQAIQRHPDNLAFRVLLADAIRLGKKSEQLEPKEESDLDEPPHAPELQKKKMSPPKAVAETGLESGAAATQNGVPSSSDEWVNDPNAPVAPAQIRATPLSPEEQGSRKFHEQLGSIRALLNASDYRGASRMLGAAVRSGLLFEKDEGVRKLRLEIEQLMRVAERRNEEASQQFAQKLKAKVIDIHNALLARDFVAAIRLAAEFERTHGSYAEISDLRRKAEAGLEGESADPAPQEPSVPELDGAAETRGHAAPESSETEESAKLKSVNDRTAVENEVLQVVHKHLATLIGPIATFILRKVRTSTANPQRQLELLVASLRDEADREAFLVHKEELLKCLGKLPSITGHPMIDTQTGPANPLGKIDADTIAHTAAALANYLGPISRVLTERAARKADSPRTLLLLLSEHLTDQLERAQFLAEVGLSE